MKKKILAALLCAAMALSATACAQSEKPDDYEDDRPSKSDKADKDKDNSSEQPGETNATSTDFFEYSKKNGTITITKYIGSDKNVVIPGTINGDAVTLIDERAFENSEVTNVSIPNGVTEIGNGTFLGCSSLVSVIIPNSVKKIGSNAFFGCTALANVIIPDSIAEIGNSAFFGCIALTSVTLPDGVNTIGDTSFFGCTVTYKGNTYSPDDYTVLYKLIMNIKEEASSSSSSKPTTPVVLETSADQFEYVEENGTIRITKYIGSETKVNIPSKINGKPVTEIRGYENWYTTTSVFDNNTPVTSVTIPNSVKTIGECAFWWCESLTSVTIPNSVTSIGDSAFRNCSSLTSVSIPNSVTTIDYNVFRACHKLTSVTIPNSVTSIHGYAFFGCTSLTSVTIPDSVTTISACAFRECTSLTSVTIPDSVTTISACAFMECTSLTSVTIPNSVITIGTDAFRNCPCTVTYKGKTYTSDDNYKGLARYGGN